MSRSPYESEPPPPWATPPVDRLICVLDAQNLAPPAIIKRLKRAFPSLSAWVITDELVDRRLRVLDQVVDVDYFKLAFPGGWEYISDIKGLENAGDRSARLRGLQATAVRIENGLENSMGVKHGVKIHAGHGETWELMATAPALTRKAKLWRGRVGVGRETARREKIETEALELLERKPLGMAAPVAAKGAMRWAKSVTG